MATGENIGAQRANSLIVRIAAARAGVKAAEKQGKTPNPRLVELASRPMYAGEQVGD